MHPVVVCVCFQQVKVFARSAPESADTVICAGAIGQCMGVYFDASVHPVDELAISKHNTTRLPEGTVIDAHGLPWRRNVTQGLSP